MIQNNIARMYIEADMFELALIESTKSVKLRICLYGDKNDRTILSAENKKTAEEALKKKAETS